MIVSRSSLVWSWKCFQKCLIVWIEICARYRSSLHALHDLHALQFPFMPSGSGDFVEALFWWPIRFYPARYQFSFVSQHIRRLLVIIQVSEIPVL